MKFSLEKINKNILLIALAVSFIRRGNFYESFIPKPFEIFFVVLVLSTAIYVLRDKKIKDFFLSIPKKIWIAMVALGVSVVVGWLTSFIKGIPSNFNMVLEFGTFGIGVATFVLVLFYTKDDALSAKKYVYALLAPVVCIVFVLLPEIGNFFGVIQGDNFRGFTTNVNIVAKTLLIPALFLVTMSLFEQNLKKKLGYIFVSSALVTLLFWTASRGALLSLALGFLLVWLIFSLHDFNWKKLFSSGIILFCIALLGFVMTPYQGKQSVLYRSLNLDNTPFDLSHLNEKSLSTILRESFANKKNPVVHRDTFEAPPAETRLLIWPFYIKKMIVNPLGFGPNTHMDSYIPNINGGYLSSGPHSTYLQIWLWGGLLGLGSFLYILFFAFKNSILKMRSNFGVQTVALLGILTTLAIALLFDDSLSMYAFWAIMALSFRK